MKIRLIQIIFVNTVLMIWSNLTAQWIQTSGPEGGPVTCIAYDDSFIYASTRGPIFRSGDNGVIWNECNQLESQVTGAAPLIAINSVLVAGTAGRGVWTRPLSELTTNIENNILCSYPKTIALYQNYPNSFNPSTTIEFTLPQSKYVELKVFNLLGKEVSTLISSKLNQGNHTYQYGGKNLASGIYYYQLVAGDYQQIKKMILIN